MTVAPTDQPLPNPPDALSHGGVLLRFAKIVPGEPSRGFVIMTKANKHQLAPIMKVIAHEFAWTPNR